MRGKGGGVGGGSPPTEPLVPSPTSTPNDPPTTMSDASPPVATSPPQQHHHHHLHHHHRLPRSKRKHTVVFKYCEEMNELNEAANNRPRTALIHSIQQENRHIRQLQQENKELRLALEEHQNVMELIMSKYRQQVAKLVSVNTKQSQPNTQDQAKLAAQIERVSEMVAVMRKAASIGDDETQQQQRVITALATENKGLREMLNIASRSGSLALPLCGVDACTQTETENEASCQEEQRPSQEQPDSISSNSLVKEVKEESVNKNVKTDGTSVS